LPPNVAVEDGAPAADPPAADAGSPAPHPPGPPGQPKPGGNATSGALVNGGGAPGAGGSPDASGRGGQFGRRRSRRLKMTFRPIATSTSGRKSVSWKWKTPRFRSRNAAPTSSHAVPIAHSRASRPWTT